MHPFDDDGSHPSTTTAPLTPDRALAALGIDLPVPSTPAGHYATLVRIGDVAYVSGQGPIDAATGTVTAGTVGGTVTLEQAREAARLATVNALAVLRQGLGSLDRVAQVAKVLVMVRGEPGFTRFPEVADGCSELLTAVFGPAGLHARSAIGVAALPFDLCVELEMVVAVVPDGRRAA